MLTPSTDSKLSAENNDLSPVHRYLAHPLQADGRCMTAARIHRQARSLFPLKISLGNATKIIACIHRACLFVLGVKHRVPTEIGLRQTTIGRCYAAKAWQALHFTSASGVGHVNLPSQIYDWLQLRVCNRHRQRPKVSGSIRTCYQLMRHTDVKTAGICCGVLLGSKQVLPGTD